MSLATGPRQTFTATFRGEQVRHFADRHFFRTTSIYSRLYAVLAYRKHPDGSVDSLPSVVRTFATPASCFKEIRENEPIRRWRDQSFVVAFEPGNTEIADAEIIKEN